MAGVLLLLLAGAVLGQDLPSLPELTHVLSTYITPQKSAIIPISDECQAAGEKYIDGLNQHNDQFIPTPSPHSLAMLDASAFFPPSGFLTDKNAIHFPGSFSGCLDIKSEGSEEPETQYCLLTVLDLATLTKLNSKSRNEDTTEVTSLFEAHMAVASNEHFLPDRWMLEAMAGRSGEEECPDQVPRFASGLLKVGKCLPKVCTKGDIVNGSLNYFLDLESLTGSPLISASNPAVAVPLACHTTDETIQMTGGDVAMITVVSLFVFLIAFSTWVDVGITVLHLPYIPTSLLPIFQGFSAYHNVIKIVSVSSGPSDGSNLACINGLKYISISWIVLGHTLWEYCLVSGHGAFAASATADIKAAGSVAFTAVWNGLIGVDTFFVIGGCLLAFHTLKEMDKAKGGSVGMWAMFYVHR